ncbi:MAG: hypothetical protein Pg6C_19430 [Treponemataceae bacterium]|nr:MAG: hypothetical protein Pg6C_19430 [Treponemataceae bacterium]
MKETLFVLFCIAAVSLAGCSQKTVPVPAAEEARQTATEGETQFAAAKTYSLTELYDLSKVKDMKYEETVDPVFWNLSMQEGMYRLFFQRNDLAEAARFRGFIENLAEFRRGEPVYDYNPVILALDEFPNALPELYKNRADLFLRGHITGDGYTISPIIHAVREKNLEGTRFFLENNVPWRDSQEMYGTRDRGGSEYPLGGSLLTDSDSRAVSDYLVSKGFEREANLDALIYIAASEINVFSQPDFNSPIICRLAKDAVIKPIKITLYKNDGYQWICFETGAGEIGWAPFLKSIDYDSGI